MREVNPLIEALDWPPIGSDDVPLEQQIEHVKLIRKAALESAAVAEAFTVTVNERDRALAENERLRLLVADALRLLQQVDLQPVKVLIQ